MTLPNMKTPNTLPCTECGWAVDADIHAEELGMCVECSYEYFKEEQ